MAATALVQIKIQPELKTILSKIADFKGLSLSSFVKMNLTQIAREQAKTIVTENGLTPEEELEILKRAKEGEALYKKGKMRFYSGKELLKKLYA